MALLERLRYSASVAEERHFGRAAERLLITQPSPSQQIKRLEAELGVQLLERDSQGLELTSAGETLLARVRPERDRWLGPNVGPKRLLGTARVPGVAWPSVDGLEHGWPGSVGVVGAECHLFAGLVLGALHVEFHADSPVGVAAENHPVTGFV